MIFKSTLNFLFCSLCIMAGVAFARGDHATENGHDDEAIGKPGTASQVSRTVHIDMNDAMLFIPANITVKEGEIIRFKLKNSGKLDHEFVLGTEQELKKHNDLMEKFPEMKHDDPTMITVAPGETGEIIWHFTRKGSVSFACLVPGHFDHGMKGNIKVLP